MLADGVCDLVLALAHQTDRRIFLRYPDPDPHLRLRLRDNSDRLIPALGDRAGTLLADGYLSRFSFDVYDWEVERYGGLAAMDATEQLYTADSHAVLDLLAPGRTGQMPFDDAALALLSIDDLLAGLGLDEQDRLRSTYRRTLRGRLAGAEYRTRQAEFCELLRSPPPHGIGDILAERRRRVEDVAARLADLDRRRLLDRPLLDLCDSYIHLHCNRLLGPDRTAEHRAGTALPHTAEPGLGGQVTPGHDRGLACSITSPTGSPRAGDGSGTPRLFSASSPYSCASSPPEPN
ncbi:thiopeptide-type bacteriocin biosynthesis protein [Streptomyces sp. NPDC050485]|uniref:thiopeptide-type bacteriocin biosynthesis protein n=1 Tax=Streptomyces sp. NPDC050485 TaxID=3365617 RepID=UPI00379B848B